MRTSSAPLSSGSSQSRMTTSGAEGADGVEPGDAVAGFVDVLHADVEQEIAHDLAHVGVVVDHQDAERLDQRLDLVLVERSHAHGARDPRVAERRTLAHRNVLRRGKRARARRCTQRDERPRIQTRSISRSKFNDDSIDRVSAACQRRYGCVSVRRTASRQPAHLRSRVASSIRGSKRRSSRQVRCEARRIRTHARRRSPRDRPRRARSSPSPPAGRPARPGCRRGTASSQSLAAMPPSTRSTVSAARRPVGAHRLEQVAGLVADRFQRGARELGDAGLAREAEDRAARLRHPNTARRGRRRPAPDRPARPDRPAAASAFTSGAVPITSSPSRSHCTAAPAMKIAPSSA